MSAVYGIGIVDLLQRGAMAVASKRTGALEYGLQTLCALVRAWDMGRYASTFRNDPDMENLLHVSTLVRAHRCAAGVSKKVVGKNQLFGCSRGGFSTKIHACVDALGNPLRFLLTGGQRHDITQAGDLITDLDFERVIADRSYDAEEFLNRIAEKEAEAVAPPRKNRKEPRAYDIHWYIKRHLIEWFFHKIK